MSEAMKKTIVTLLVCLVLSMVLSFFLSLVALPIFVLLLHGVLTGGVVQTVASFWDGASHLYPLEIMLIAVTVALLTAATVALILFFRSLVDHIDQFNSYFKSLYKLIFTLLIAIPPVLLLASFVFGFPMGVVTSIVEGLMALLSGWFTIVLRKVLPETKEIDPARQLLF